MKVYTPMKYYGRNIENKPIIDFENSGKIVYGCMANLEAIAIVACKIYDSILRIDVIEDWYSTKLDIDEAVERYLDLIYKYNPNQLGGRNIQVFGNDIGNQICKLPLAKPDDSKGYEIIDINPENLMFSVQSKLNNYIKFEKNIRGSWYNELKNFDLVSFRNNEQSYHRIIALANIISGARTYSNYSDMPNRVIKEICYHNKIKLTFVKAVSCDSKYESYKDYYKSEDDRYFIRHHGHKQDYNRVIKLDEWEEIKQIN